MGRPPTRKLKEKRGVPPADDNRRRARGIILAYIDRVLNIAQTPPGAESNEQKSWILALWDLNPWFLRTQFEMDKETVAKLREAVWILQDRLERWMELKGVDWSSIEIAGRIETKYFKPFFAGIPWDPGMLSGLSSLEDLSGLWEFSRAGMLYWLEKHGTPVDKIDVDCIEEAKHQIDRLRAKEALGLAVPSRKEEPTTERTGAESNYPWIRFEPVESQEGVWVMGNYKGLISPTNAKVIRRLIELYPNAGARKGELVALGGDAAVGNLKNLAKKDPDWRKVLLFPGVGGQGQGYRLRHLEEESAG